MSLFGRFYKALGFTGEMAKTKIVDSAEGFAKILVKLDPKGASETQLRIMREQLEKASLVLATKRVELDKEQKEADAAEAEYNKYKKAAQLLNDKITADPSLEATQGKKLDELIAKTKDLKAAFEKEKLEADAVREIVEILDETINAKFEQIKQAERALGSVQREIEKQKIIEDNAKAKEDLEELTKSTNDFSFAVEAMNEEANKLKAKNMSREALKTLSDGTNIDNDTFIQDLVKEAEGKSPETRASRLAEL